MRACGARYRAELAEPPWARVNEKPTPEKENRRRPLVRQRIASFVFHGCCEILKTDSRVARRTAAAVFPFHAGISGVSLATEVAICNSATALPTTPPSRLLLSCISLPFTGCLVAGRNPIDDVARYFLKAESTISSAAGNRTPGGCSEKSGKARCWQFNPSGLCKALG